MMGANVKFHPMPNLSSECDDNKEDYFNHCELKFITLLKQCYIKRSFPEVLFSELDDLDKRMDLFNPVQPQETYKKHPLGEIISQLNKTPSLSLYNLYLNQPQFLHQELLEFEMYLFYSLRNKFIPKIENVLNELLPLLYQNKKSKELLGRYESYLFSLTPWLEQGHTQHFVDREEALIIYNYLCHQKRLFV